MFDASEFLPRGECCRSGQWPEGLQTSYIAAHAAIALAYFVNPFLLMWMYRASTTVNRLLSPWRSFLPLYAAFIFCCGTGHLLEGIAAFWWPDYRLFTVWNWLTALASWIPTIAIPVKVHALISNADSGSDGDRHKDGAEG